MSYHPAKAKQAEKDARKRMVFLMNQLSPGTEWCTRFLTCCDESALAGISESEVASVRAWKARVDHLRTLVQKDPNMKAVPMTDADKTQQREIKSLQTKFGRQVLGKATQQKPGQAQAPRAASSSESASKPARPEPQARQPKPAAPKASPKAPAATPPREKEPSPKVAKTPEKKLEAQTAETDEHAGAASDFASAGVIAFALRERSPNANFAASNAVSLEAVVLMVAQKGNHTTLSLPARKAAKSADSVSTGARAFTEDTKNLFRVGLDALGEQIKSLTEKHHFTRCFHQNNRFALHFAQIPYVADISGVFSRIADPATDLRIESLYWVPLSQFVRAGVEKKVSVEASPGKWRRLPYYGFLHELLQNKKVADKLALLQRLVSTSTLTPMQAPHFTSDDAMETDGSPAISPEENESAEAEQTEETPAQEDGSAQKNRKNKKDKKDKKDRKDKKDKKEKKDKTDKKDKKRKRKIDQAEADSSDQPTITSPKRLKLA